MLIELFIALIFGILIGIITGLLPGIHINLVGSILVSLSASIFLGIPPIILVTFIVAMSITHVFLDFIPSIYLGAPNTETQLSVLPGHQLLLEGKAHEAILLTSLGSLIAVIITVIISPILILLIPYLNTFSKLLIPYILLSVSLFLIFTEKNKFQALFIFILAGILGISVLKLPLTQPLLPMLSGLFGASTLLISIKNKTKIPQQKIGSIKEILSVKKVKIISSSSISIFISSLFGFLPALGSGQTAIISSQIKKNSDNQQFLIMLGAANTVIMILSFITLFTINKSRTGSAAAINQLIPKLTLNYFILILIIIFLTGIISFYLTIKLSKIFAKTIEKINYSKISISILIFLTIIVFIFSSFIGLLIFIISTSLGIYTNLSNVKRTNLIACLIMPTIFIYIL